MMRIRTAMAYSLAAVAFWSAAATGVAAANGLAVEPPPRDPATLIAPVPIAGAGDIASGSGNRQGFDPGPYPNLEECERARARYYDPSQLECVPVRGNR
ncbi:hypothetical protein [Nocardia wallacei]|uniref:hypothetical protein n=1 Tax=Nocardia wallacei TaxID=480035 RepID=UPI0024586E49|nr:hypothetical protein [Nocardia wallacei]